MRRLRHQAENLQAFIMAVSNCNTYVSILTLIIIQLVIFMRE